MKCDWCERIIPKSVITVALASSSDKGNKFLLKWLDAKEGHASDPMIKEATGDTCMSCYEAADVHTCGDFYAPQSLALEIWDCPPSLRADVLYHYEDSKTCCEDCNKAYTDECPLVAHRVAHVFARVGDIDIRKLLNDPENKKGLLESMAKFTEPIQVCEEFEPTKELWEEWDDVPPFPAGTVIDMSDFSIEEDQSPTQRIN